MKKIPFNIFFVVFVIKFYLIRMKSWKFFLVFPSSHVF